MMMKQALLVALVAITLAAGKPTTRKDGNTFFVDMYEMLEPKPSELKPGVPYNVDPKVHSMEIDCSTNTTDPSFSLSHSFDSKVFQNDTKFKIEKSTRPIASNERTGFKVSFTHLLEDVKVFLTCEVKNKAGKTNSTKVSIVIKAITPKHIVMDTIPPNKQKPLMEINKLYHEESLVVLNCSTDVAGGKFDLKASPKSNSDKVKLQINPVGNGSLWSSFRVNYTHAVENVKVTLTCSLSNSSSTIKTAKVVLDIKPIQVNADILYSLDPKGKFQLLKPNDSLSFPPKVMGHLFINCSTSETGRFQDVNAKPTTPKSGILKIKKVTKNPKSTVFDVTYYPDIIQVKNVFTCEIYDSDKATKQLLNSTSVNIVLEPMKASLDLYKYEKSNKAVLIAKNEVLPLEYFDETEQNLKINCTSNWTNGDISIVYLPAPTNEIVISKTQVLAKNAFSSVFLVTYTQPNKDVKFKFICSSKDAQTKKLIAFTTVAAELNVPKVSADLFRIEGKTQTPLVNGTIVKLDFTKTEKIVHLNCSTNITGPFLNLSMDFVDKHDATEEGNIIVVRETDPKQDTSVTFQVNYVKLSKDVKVKFTCNVFNRRDNGIFLNTTNIVADIQVPKATLKISELKYIGNKVEEVPLEYGQNFSVQHNLAIAEMMFGIKCETSLNATGKLALFYNFTSKQDETDAKLKIVEGPQMNTTRLFNVTYNPKLYNVEFNLTCVQVDNDRMYNATFVKAVIPAPHSNIQLFHVVNGVNQLQPNKSVISIDTAATQKAISINCTTDNPVGFMQLNYTFVKDDEKQQVNATVKETTESKLWTLFTVSYQQTWSNITGYLTCSHFEAEPAKGGKSLNSTTLVTRFIAPTATINMYQITKEKNEPMKNGTNIKIDSKLQPRSLQFNCSTTVQGRTLKLQPKFKTNDDEVEAGVQIKQDKTGTYWTSFNVTYSKTKFDVEAKLSCEHYSGEKGQLLNSTGVVVNILDGGAVVDMLLVKGKDSFKLKNEQDLPINQTTDNTFQINCTSIEKDGWFTLNHTYNFDEDKAEANLEVKVKANQTGSTLFDVTYKKVSYEVKGKLSCLRYTKDSAGKISDETFVHTVFEAFPSNINMSINQHHLQQGDDFILNRTQGTFDVTCQTNLTKKFFALNSTLSAVDQQKVELSIKLTKKDDTTSNFTVTYNKMSPEVTFNLSCDLYTKEKGHLINTTHLVANIIEEVQDISIYRIEGKTQTLMTNQSKFTLDGRSDGFAIVSCNTTKENRQLQLEVMSTETKITIKEVESTKKSKAFKISYPLVKMPTLADVKCVVVKGSHNVPLNATTVHAEILGNAVEMKMYQGKTLLKMGEDVIIRKGETKLEITCESNVTKQTFNLSSSLTPAEVKKVGLKIVLGKVTDKTAIYDITFLKSAPEVVFNFTCKQYNKDSEEVFNTTYAVANIIAPKQEITTLWMDPKSHKVVSDGLNHKVDGVPSGAIVLNFTTPIKNRELKVDYTINNEPASNYNHTGIKVDVTSNAVIMTVNYRPEMLEEDLNVTASMYTINHVAGGKLLNTTRSVLTIGKAVPLVELSKDKTKLKNGDLIKLEAKKEDTFNLMCQTNFEGRRIDMSVDHDKDDKNAKVTATKGNTGTTSAEFVVKYDQSTFVKNVTLTCKLYDDKDDKTVLTSTKVLLNPYNSASTMQLSILAMVLSVLVAFLRN